MFICILMLSALSSHNALWAPRGGPRYTSTTRLFSVPGFQRVYKERAICASEKRAKMWRKMGDTIICRCPLPTNKSGNAFQQSTNDLDHRRLTYPKNRCSQPWNTGLLSNLARTTSFQWPSRHQKGAWAVIGHSYLAVTSLPKMKACFTFLYLCFLPQKDHILAVNEWFKALQGHENWLAKKIPHLEL